jgi:hypothetical protein
MAAEYVIEFQSTEEAQRAKMYTMARPLRYEMQPNHLRVVVSSDVFEKLKVTNLRFKMHERCSENG